VQLSRALALLACSATASCGTADVVIGTRDAAGIAAERGFVPVGIQNVNDSRLSSTSFRALLRFVPRADIEIDRVYFGFKLQGAACWDPAPDGNGAGDGGTLHGALVDIDAATGLPAGVLDEETVGACARHDEAKAESSATPVLGWITARAALAGGRMYGLVIDNSHGDPEHHFFSFQMPLADAELAGAQARNELRAGATDSIMSLDPREHVAWSTDGGTTYRYGAENGEYASFIGEGSAHPATRIPQYGFRLTDGSMLAGQPYYAYQTTCSDCAALYSSARSARSFLQLGGFTATDEGVGTLTLTNTTTSATASCTPEPGYGFRTCELERALQVGVGDSYSVHATGTVEVMRLDQQQRTLFPTVGSADGDWRAGQAEPAPGTHEQDVPSAWAGPLSSRLP
jgi:hypothetical protein